jgi:hypothetical protein
MEKLVFLSKAALAPGQENEFHMPKWFNFVLDRQRWWLAKAEREVDRLFAA